MSQIQKAVQYVNEHKEAGTLCLAISDACVKFGIDYRFLLNYFKE